MTYHTGISHFGWLGVQLFFVLSGFLITGILWNERSRPENTGFKLRKFWVRRTLRIFPLYFGYLFIVGLSYTFTHFPGYYPVYIPYLVTYTYNFTRTFPGWIGNPMFTHLWSLSVEEQFYFFFPLCVLFLPPRWTKSLMLTIIVAAPLIRYALGLHYYAEGMRTGALADTVYWNTASHLDAFFLGGIIPVLSLHKRLRRPWPLFFIAAFLAAAAGALDFYTSKSGNNYFTDLGYDHGQYLHYEWIWHYTLLDLVFATLILALVSPRAANSFNGIRHLLEHRWLVAIGKVSYGMYVFHWLLFVYLFQDRIYPLVPGSVRPFLLLPYLALVYGVAYLSFHLYEKRFIVLKDRFFPSTKAVKRMPLLLLPLLLGLVPTRAQTVRKVGCGEYARYILGSDNILYEDYWNGHSVNLTPVNTQGHKILDISGALYSAVGIDDDGFAWVFSQGKIAAARITKDSSDAPFDKNIACAGYFGTYVTIRKDGAIWMWGNDAWSLFSDLGNAVLSKPVRLKMPPGVKGFTRIRAGNSLMALTTDGTVYLYNHNKGLPVRMPLPRPASDIAASHSGFFIAIVPDNIQKSNLGYPYGYGAESIYFGVAGPLQAPVPLRKAWGLTSPIRKIVANHNTIHFIDSLGRLFGLGDNPNGEVGNGTELVNHAELYHPPAFSAGRPYAWDWVKHEALVTRPVQIGIGIHWKDVWADNSYAFYHYAIDENDSSYFWGRSKSFVSGTAVQGEDTYPNALDVLTPRAIHVFTTPDKDLGKFVPYSCSAGEDRTAITDTIRLSGHAVPSSGYMITAYKWTRVSGPACTIEDPASPSTVVTGCSTPGLYAFSLMITDNNTATISDTVHIRIH